MVLSQRDKLGGTEGDMELMKRGGTSLMVKRGKKRGGPNIFKEKKYLKGPSGQGGSPEDWQKSYRKKLGLGIRKKSSGGWFANQGEA